MKAEYYRHCWAVDFFVRTWATPLPSFQTQIHARTLLRVAHNRNREWYWTVARDLGSVQSQTKRCCLTSSIIWNVVLCNVVVFCEMLSLKCNVMILSPPAAPIVRVLQGFLEVQISPDEAPCQKDFLLWHWTRAEWGPRWLTVASVMYFKSQLQGWLDSSSSVQGPALLFPFGVILTVKWNLIVIRLSYNRFRCTAQLLNTCSLRWSLKLNGSWPRTI